ncbi:MAG: hypothetical protein WDO72_08150 [Pseudomonadota bacterium]
MLREGIKWLSLLALACAGMQRAVNAAPPQRLSDTGLYVAGSASIVRDDVLPFAPQYPLWSDGAVKRRWIWLPPGTSIDATQPDAWDFPRGTKLWKEFSQGRRIETRFIERQADGEWSFASYVWNAEGSEATLVPAAGIRALAVPAAPGGRYEIPAEADCRACHEGAPVPVLGFSALQLSKDRDALAPHADAPGAWPDLRSLTARQLLKNLPPELLAQPPRIAAANSVERAALGYLHGNCGHCHNDDGPLAVLDMTLAQRVARPAAAGDVLRSLGGVPSQFRAAGAPAGASRVAPGHAAASVLALRMNSRDPLQQMPPLGTAVADPQALALIARWIDGLSVQ